MIRTLVQRLKPLVTRRNLWVDRCHRVLLDRWDQRTVFTIDHLLPHLLMRRRPACMVQIGACDGLLDDPVEPYIRSGYLQGLLVEPQPEAFAALPARYDKHAGIRLENSALAANPGTIQMHRLKQSHRHLLPAHAYGMATTAPQALVTALGAATSDPWDAIETIEVEAVTWTELFRRHPMERVDLLQIDTEGLDGELLECFPFETFKPLLIHFEWVHLREPALGDLFNRLMDLGYHLHQSGINALASWVGELDHMPLLPRS